MSDFINRNDLIRKLESWDYKANGIPNYAWKVINELTKADVRENVHGEWVYKDDNVLIQTGYWECSVCKEGRLMYEQNFCPHCGADMRGGASDGMD